MQTLSKLASIKNIIWTDVPQLRRGAANTIAAELIIWGLLLLADSFNLNLAVR